MKDICVEQASYVHSVLCTDTATAYYKIMRLATKKRELVFDAEEKEKEEVVV